MNKFKVGDYVRYTYKMPGSHLAYGSVHIVSALRPHVDGVELEGQNGKLGAANDFWYEHRFELVSPEEPFKVLDPQGGVWDVNLTNGEYVCTNPGSWPTAYPKNDNPSNWINTVKRIYGSSPIPTSTPFEPLNYGAELSLCAAYYEQESATPSKVSTDVVAAAEAMCKLAEVALQWSKLHLAVVSSDERLNKQGGGDIG